MLLYVPSPVKYNVATFLFFSNPFAYISYTSTKISSFPCNDPILLYVIFLPLSVSIPFKYWYCKDTDVNYIVFSNVYP